MLLIFILFKATYILLSQTVSGVRQTLIMKVEKYERTSKRCAVSRNNNSLKLFHVSVKYLVSDFC